MQNEIDSKLVALLQVRLAVGALGEQNNWWNTACCDPKKNVVFRQLFPKSWRLAAFSAVSEAAKRVHRESVTNRAQHLFRFETEIEQDLRKFLTTPSGEALFDKVVGAPEQTLVEYAEKGVHVRAGAFEIGVAEPDVIFGAVPKLVGLYLAAFRHGTTTFPYFQPRSE